MSGYYCRDCNAIKPLFDSPEPPDLGIPCLGAVPFDPELARYCDLGISPEALRDTCVGRRLEQIAQRLLDSLESSASADHSRELPLGKEPSR